LVIRLRRDACCRGIFLSLALLLALAATGLVVLFESTANGRVYNVVLLRFLLVVALSMLGLRLVVEVILVDASDAALSYVVIVALGLGLG
jgi:hypothetical protein